MITKPRPRLARVLCWLAGGCDQRPLTWLEERPSAILGSPDLELVEVTDARFTRCTTCGKLVQVSHHPDPATVRAGLRSLIGPDDQDDTWGDARLHRPGGWGVRVDFIDPPREDRAELERQLDDLLRRPPLGRSHLITWKSPR